ncbi:MAG: hypothetical protein AAFP90_11320 [Planctomycetota bacterium]
MRAVRLFCSNRAGKGVLNKTALHRFCIEMGLLPADQIARQATGSNRFTLLLVEGSSAS